MSNWWSDACPIDGDCRLKENKQEQGLRFAGIQASG